MSEQSTEFIDNSPKDPALLRTLAAAGLPGTGRFSSRGGWVSRVWVGDEYVVRLSNGQFRDSFRHEAKVVNLLTGSEVPHARHLGHGEGPDGPWSVSERLPGHTLHDAWPGADLPTRRAIIESLGVALRALHQVPVPADLMPPWLADALAGKPRVSFHPSIVSAALEQVEVARQQPGCDSHLLAAVADWVRERLPLFATDELVLVHGDIHGSNVMVDEGRVTGLVDFAEAVAQPADLELDIILRWCAKSSAYPPKPDEQGLDEKTLTDVPRWLRGAYPELFEREHLRERLLFYDMQREVALYAHLSQTDEREAAHERVARVLAGHNHLDGLAW